MGNVSGIPSPGLSVHTPSPNSQALHLFQPSSPLDPPLVPSHPLHSRPFFPQQPSSLPALPAPISPPTPIPSSTPLAAPSTLLLPSLSCPHLSGVGGLGGWPPPQPGCGSGGGGWLSLSWCRCQGGATGFGGVLAPADGGEVRVGGWTHNSRNGGGLSPQLPPCLPSFPLSLRAWAAAAAAAMPPTPPQRLLVSGAGQEVGGGDRRPVLPIATQGPRHLLPASPYLEPSRVSSAGLCFCLSPLAPAASFQSPNPS